MQKEKNIRDDFKSLRTNRQFLTILILLFIASFFWIFISLLSSQSKTEVSKELTLLARPLIPTIDKEALQKIEKKRSYSADELSYFTIYKLLTTRDGRTEMIVPLDVTIDDIDPINVAQPTIKPAGFSSLLQDEIQNPDGTLDENNATDEGTRADIQSATDNQTENQDANNDNLPAQNEQ